MTTCQPKVVAFSQIPHLPRKMSDYANDHIYIICPITNKLHKRFESKQTLQNVLSNSRM